MFYILDTWTHKLCRKYSGGPLIEYSSEYEAEEAARRINNAYGFDSESDKRYKVTTIAEAWS